MLRVLVFNDMYLTVEYELLRLTHSFCSSMQRRVQRHVPGSGLWH
jgi:hypothetical protein